MPHLPFRRLFIGPQYGIAVAGNQLQVVSFDSGSLLASVVACSTGLVTAADVSWSARRVVTTGDDKILNVWVLGEQSEAGFAVTQESSREIPKKSSEIHLTSDGKTILASDKFGDIYQYPMVQPPAPENVNDPSNSSGPSEPARPPKGKAKKSQQKSEEKPRHGELVLGHTSVITSFLLTPRDDFVISGDRDEHIRISWFPEGYNIERFCMGHLKYLSALHIPPSSPHTLISGGGDPDILVWNWTDGSLLQRIPVIDKVKPLARVKGGRRAFQRLARRPDGEGLSRKSKRGKGKQKHPSEGDEADAEGAQDDAEDEAAADDGDSPNHDDPMTTQTHAQPGDTKLLHKFDPSAESFVVGRIGSTKIGSEILVLFSAVGASGIFYFPLQEGSSGSGMEAHPEVQVLDLEYPVLDFCVPLNDPSSVWVSVDGTWKSEESSSTETSIPKMVKLVHWSEGRFMVYSESEDSRPLLKGLNESLVTAAESVVSSLELYAQLAWLPKSREEEADDSGEAQQDEAPVTGTSPGPSTPNVEGEAKTPTNKPPRKPAGRLKTREKLQRIQESGLSSVAPKPTLQADTEEPEGGEIQAKKAKVDAPQSESP